MYIFKRIKDRLLAYIIFKWECFALWRTTFPKLHSFSMFYSCLILGDPSAVENNQARVEAISVEREVYLTDES